jgi:hypothetical protein
VGRLVVLIIAVGVYLWFLPVNFVATDTGLIVLAFPDLVYVSDGALMGINWNYLFLLPVMLIIILIGFELLRLFGRRTR